MIAQRRWARATVVATVLGLAAAPFLFVTIPPLLDAPGHLGQYAIQAAAPHSPLRAYFDFNWALLLNLGCDVLVEVLRHPLGLERAFWLVTAAIPVLTVAGIVAIGRYANPGSAAAWTWALPFAYAYPFLYGFLNFSLALALSLLGFGLWCRLSGAPRMREALFWVILPLLMICHAIGGGLLPLMIASYALGSAWERRAETSLVRQVPMIVADLRPLVAVLPVILLWLVSRPDSHLPTHYDLVDKGNAIVLALRDQHRLLDLGSIVAIIAIPLVGAVAGARFGVRRGAVVSVIGFAFVAIPSQLSGVDFTDMRMVPALAITALTLQDWTRVPRRLAALVTITGAGLFAIRIAVAATGFAQYEQSYRAESAALPHVASGSRVLALVTRQCRASRSWRMDRLDHLPALASVRREAWTNTNWDIGDIHLLRIRYRPSEQFYDDPSQYVWPERCLVGQPPPANANEFRTRRRMIDQVMPDLPLDRIDYLWLIQTKLPAGPWSARLAPVWSNGASSLYRIKAPRPLPPAA